jgi:hypothetical protein
VDNPLFDLVASLRRHFADAVTDARADAEPTLIAKAAQRALKVAHDAWPGRERWACRSGCAFCCHNAVSVSAPEALRLARAVRALPDAERAEVERALAAHHARTEGQDMAALARARHPCALLSGAGTCRVYAARPLPCIGTASLDAGACEALLRAPDRAPQVPVDIAWVAASGAHNVALRLALREAGFPPPRYELHDALSAVLHDPDAERRWLAGEDPFAGCRLDPTSAGPDAAAELERLDAWTRGGPG